MNVDKKFVELCKTKLFEYIVANPGEVFDAFFLGPKWQREHTGKTREAIYNDEPDMPSVEDFEKPARIFDNWECYDEDYEYMKDDNKICFNCIEYDDQLRGYVHFNEDGEIIAIEVCGE